MKLFIYRVRKQWQKCLKNSSDVIFEPTKMPLVSFKRCIQVDFKTELPAITAKIEYYQANGKLPEEKQVKTEIDPTSEIED